MSIEKMSGSFGISGRAIQPVPRISHTGPANEYPPSGEQKQPQTRALRKPETQEGETAPAESAGTIYNAKGDIVHLDGPAFEFKV